VASPSRGSGRREGGAGTATLPCVNDEMLEGVLGFPTEPVAKAAGREARTGAIHASHGTKPERLTLSHAANYIYLKYSRQEVFRAMLHTEVALHLVRRWHGVVGGSIVDVRLEYRSGVELWTRPLSDNQRPVVTELAALTGGHVFAVHRTDELQATFANVVSQFRGRYL
jgi:hypothetical protein